MVVTSNGETSLPVDETVAISKVSAESNKYNVISVIEVVWSAPSSL